MFFDTEENVNSIFPQKNTLSKPIYTNKNIIKLFYSPKTSATFCKTIKKAKMTILAEHLDNKQIKWYFVYVHENSSVEATTLTGGSSVLLPRNYKREGIRGNLYAWVLATDIN